MYQLVTSKKLVLVRRLLVVPLVFRVFIDFAGCGRTGPDPSSDIVLDDGTIVPLGKGVDTKVDRSSLLYNEYPLRCDKLARASEQAKQ